MFYFYSKFAWLVASSASHLKPVTELDLMLTSLQRITSDTKWDLALAYLSIYLFNPFNSKKAGRVGKIKLSTAVSNGLKNIANTETI